MPTITASTTTCSNSPLAKAPTKLSGTMCMMKLDEAWAALPWRSAAGTAALDTAIDMPLPMCSRLPATRPTTSAMVDTTSK